MTVADGASTDQTLAIASRMRDQDPAHVGVIHLDKGGHGLAVRSAWLASDAQVVAYMDAGLSTDLHAIPDLVTPLLVGCADVACGSRLSRGAQATCRRGSELASRCHNLLLNLAFSYHASDAQCPLKAMRAQVARTFLPIVQDDGRFFDTELLVVSHQAGLTVREVPVTWVEHPDATTGAPGAARRELACVMRLRADIRAHVLDTRIASVCPAGRLRQAGGNALAGAGEGAGAADGVAAHRRSRTGMTPKEEPVPTAWDWLFSSSCLLLAPRPCAYARPWRPDVLGARL